MARPNETDEVKFSLCKIGAQLPGGHGPCAMGSGCLVKIKKEDAAKLDVQEGDYLVTTNEVLDKEKLTPGGKPTAEFLVKSRAGERQTFHLNDARRFSAVVVEPAERASEEIHILLIPLKQIPDQRSLLKRWKSKSVLQCARPLACSFQTIDVKAEVMSGLFCHVLSDSPRDSQPFHFRTYTFELDDSCALFLREPGSETEVTASKDFSKEERPRGGAIINSTGEFVGVVSFRDGKIAPVWIAKAIEGETSFYSFDL